MITGSALSLPAVGGSATTVPGMGETEDEKKGVKRAARVKLIWERFSTRQLILCAVKENSLGTQVPTIMRDISKCLNNSSRALFLKLRASAFLAVGGPTSTWSCHLEVGLLSAIQLDKLETSVFVSEGLKKLF